MVSHRSPVTARESGRTHGVSRFGFPIGRLRSVTGWTLQGPHGTIARCIDVAIPAIEIVDYRYELWTLGALQEHPLNVMAWLANELPEFGLRFRAGDLVTTGVTTDVFEANAGDQIFAQFDGLGSVAVSFSASG